MCTEQQITDLAKHNKKPGEVQLENCWRGGNEEAPHPVNDKQTCGKINP